MKRKIEFCSNIGLNGDEPIEGSAIAFAGFIFISWPKIMWARAQYDSEGLPSHLVLYLKELQKNHKIATRFFGDRAKTSDRCDLFIYPQSLAAKNIPIDSIVTVIDSALNGRENNNIQTEKNIHLFCCTHGKRDKCCAKFGYDVVLTARNYITKRGIEDVEVHECTHLGGDRFAATAISFPAGHMYGRLRSQDLDHLMPSIIAGRPYSPNYRGSVYLTGPKQTAEAWIHRKLHETKLDGTIENIQEIAVTEETRAVKARLRIKKDGAEIASDVEIIVERATFSQIIDCSQIESGTRATINRWVVREFVGLDINS